MWHGLRLGYTLKRHLRRRAAVEPEIGHMKNDGLLGRNFLKGMAGDAINAILCGAGHNLRKILAKVRSGLYGWAATTFQRPWWTRFLPPLRLQAA